MPTFSSETISRASQAHAAGRLDDCLKICRVILDSEPENNSALLLVGVCLAKKGQSAEAIPILERVVRQDVTSFQAALWLSMAQRKLGLNSGAVESARSAVKRNPNDPQGQNQLGLCLVDCYLFAQAESCFKAALDLAPNVSIIHYGLGLAYQGQKMNAEAVSAFRKSAQLDPKSLSTQTTIRQVLMDELDPEGATECARAVLKLQPESAEANLWLARTLTEDNKAGEAEPFVRAAEQLNPESALTYTLMGSILQGTGKIDEADAAFRRSIEISPSQGSAYSAFASNRKMTELDRPIISQMQSMLESGRLSPQHLSQLHYALGKASEDLGEYQRAMEHFDHANRLAYEAKFGSRVFDRSVMSSSFNFTIQTYTREFLSRNRGKGSESTVPIFVLGMMRSGTTLAEQILSSHPKVGPAGEQRFWSDHRNVALRDGGSTVDAKQLKQMASDYEQRLQAVAPRKAHVVDKMPSNYMAIGVIHLAFPNAKIIHTTRNPVDTCISVYTTPNRTRLEWAHDRANIVFAYREYQRLMNHWQNVLPKGIMIEVKYEDVVSNREQVTRDMVSFCDLDWDDACMKPELNERSVVTPSVWQVRQPVYKTSMERWRKYEPWLGEFRSLLSD